MEDIFETIANATKPVNLEESKEMKTKEQIQERIDRFKGIQKTEDRTISIMAGFKIELLEWVLNETD